MKKYLVFILLFVACRGAFGADIVSAVVPITLTSYSHTSSTFLDSLPTVKSSTPYGAKFVVSFGTNTYYGDSLSYVFLLGTGRNQIQIYSIKEFLHHCKNTGPLVDNDADGWPDMLEIILGTDRFDAVSYPLGNIEDYLDLNSNSSVEVQLLWVNRILAMLFGAMVFRFVTLRMIL